MLNLILIVIRLFLLLFMKLLLAGYEKIIKRIPDVLGLSMIADRVARYRAIHYKNLLLLLV